MVLGFRIASLLARLIDIYQILIIAWCILSWIPRGNGTFLDDVASALDTLCSPWINLFRRWIPPLGGIDFSPVVALLALQLIMRLVLYILV